MHIDGRDHDVRELPITNVTDGMVCRDGFARMKCGQACVTRLTLS